MDAVLFDWGETLVTEIPTNYANPFCEAFFMVCKNTISRVDLENTVTKINLSIFKNLKNKKLTVPYSIILKILVDTLGIKPDCSNEDIEFDCYLKTFTPLPKVNAHKTLSAIVRRNIKVGIITNNRFSAATITKIFNNLFPDVNLSACVSSADYIIGKPNPLLFEIALKKINCEPENVIFCGDRVKYDIKGAMDFGIKSALLKSQRNQRIPDNTLIINDLSALLKLL